MTLLNQISLCLILLTVAYLVVFGSLALVRPSIAGQFLLGFAQNAKWHYIELFIRSTIGWALVHHSGSMSATKLVELLGWVLICTTACLSVMPWRWHRLFAQKTVPYANRHLRLIGLISFISGVSLWNTLNFID